jgi:hypothetical protein
MRFSAAGMSCKLAAALASAGKHTETWKSPDGSVALVLPYGGRVLGLFAPESERNFFWTHPALETAETARDFYRSPQWHNSGGDRTWLAPEIDFFFPNFPNLEPYWQPREFDPGNYQLTRSNDGLVWTNRFTYKLSRSQQTIDLAINKRLMPALNPLRDFAKRLSYAGYMLRTGLAFGDGKAAAAQVGLWSLLQLRHGGEMILPTFSKPSVTTFFGHIEPADLSVEPHLVRYRMRARGEQKLGLQVLAVIGRAGYLYAEGDECCLVVRNFSVNPSGQYVDAPWREPGRAGFAIEACNINSHLGRFSELEYHVPAIGGPGGEHACEDVSQVWAFRGRREDILEAARTLISTDV